MTRSFRASVWVGVLCCAVASHGCSWIFVAPAPQAPRELKELQEPDCTQSPALPVTDTVFAAAFGAIAVASLVGLAEQNANRCDSSDSQEFCIDLDFTGAFVTIAVLAGAGAGVHTASAVYGYGKTSECQQAREDWFRQQFEAQSRARDSEMIEPRSP